MGVNLQICRTGKSRVRCLLGHRSEQCRAYSRDRRAWNIAAGEGRDGPLCASCDGLARPPGQPVGRAEGHQCPGRDFQGRSGAGSGPKTLHVGWGSPRQVRHRPRESQARTVTPAGAWPKVHMLWIGAGRWRSSRGDAGSSRYRLESAIGRLAPGRLHLLSEAGGNGIEGVLTLTDMVEQIVLEAANGSRS